MQLINLIEMEKKEKNCSFISVSDWKINSSEVCYEALLLTSPAYFWYTRRNGQFAKNVKQSVLAHFMFRLTSWQVVFLEVGHFSQYISGVLGESWVLADVFCLFQSSIILC
jgi:hypothetical protein